MAIGAQNLSKARSQLVVKGNELITKSRYDLSVQQQRMLLYMISLVQPTHNVNTVYEMEINDFCEVAGLDKNNEYYFVYLKEDLKKLADASIWVETEPGKQTLVRWLNTITITEKDGTIRFSFHQSIDEYLFELKTRYTKYELIQVLAFRCKYSFRLYEYLKVFSYKAYPDGGLDYRPLDISVELEDFKHRMSCENYSRFVDLKRNVIEKAIEEINSLTTDIRVKCKYIKDGKKVVGIVFMFQPISDTDTILTSYERRKILNRSVRRNKSEVEK